MSPGSALLLLLAFPGKPFNPLLGETFELDRSRTKGYKAVIEQVG
jgi:hypothetical protein